MSIAVGVDKAKELVEQDDALLVCAYDDDEKCKKLGVDESIPMSGLQSRLGDVPKSRPLVFFCG